MDFFLTRVSFFCLNQIGTELVFAFVVGAIQFSLVFVIQSFVFVRINKPNCAISIPVRFKKSHVHGRFHSSLSCARLKLKKKTLQTTTCQCNYIFIWYFRQRFFKSEKERERETELIKKQTHSLYYNLSV